MRNRWLAVPVLAAAAVIGLAACGSSSPSSSSTTPPAAPAASTGSSSAPSSGASGIKLTSISGHQVLTDSQGFVLYWFAPDTPTKSNCNGSCASFWPPATGTPSAAAGVSLTGKLGTIKRADGTTQATYMGHPLYTYKGDSSPGKDSGNALNISGGLWWAMTQSGAKIKAGAAAAPHSTSSTGGNGY